VQHRIIVGRAHAKASATSTPAHVATRKDECRCSCVDDGLSFERSPGRCACLSSGSPSHGRRNYRKPRLVSGRLVETRFDQRTWTVAPSLRSRSATTSVPRQWSTKNAGGSSGRRTHLPAQGAFHDGRGNAEVVRQFLQRIASAEPLSQGLGRHRGSGNDRTPRRPGGDRSRCAWVLPPGPPKDRCG